MKFAIKLCLGGAASALAGLWCMFDGWNGGPLDHLLGGGLLWKGALLFVVGLAAAVMGYRMMQADADSLKGNGPVDLRFKKRMTIHGIGVDKIYVFAKGREASLPEMIMVMGHPGCKIESNGKDDTLKIVTEEWNPSPGESEADAIRRIARETSAKHPGLSILAFAWPDTYPTIIAVYATETEFPCPFPSAWPLARIGAVTVFQVSDGI